MLVFPNPVFPNHTYLTQWECVDIRLQPVEAEQVEGLCPAETREPDERQRRHYTERGGRGDIFQQEWPFFQLRLLSTQVIYWKGGVEMCEVSLRITL